MFTQPKFADAFPQLTIGQSQRMGGVSPFPKNALNLGLYTEDGLENVLENRRRFARAINWNVNQIAGAKQTHGSAIHRVISAGEYVGYDALITNQKNILLTITTADCIPVLIYDPEHEAFGAAHAGWKGTVAQIAPKTLRMMMAEFSTKPEDCYVYLGAGIQHCYFEVQNDVAQHFASHLVESGPKPGKFFVDLPTANQEQLVELGVNAKQIERSVHGTVANNDLYFSYRKEGGKTGRMLAVIGELSSVVR